jgi:hypothetical protein
MNREAEMSQTKSRRIAHVLLLLALTSAGYLLGSTRGHPLAVAEAEARQSAVDCDATRAAAIQVAWELAKVRTDTRSTLPSTVLGDVTNYARMIMDGGATRGSSCRF